MLKRISIILASLLLPMTPAEAVTLPNWLTKLTTDVSDAGTQATCVALAVYYESRGESVRGQRAVASVVMNRARSGRYRDTACEVVFQPHQFSFIHAQPLNPTGAAWDRAMEIGKEFVERSDTEVPYLSFSSEHGLRGFRIGGHIFR